MRCLSQSTLVLTMLLLGPSALAIRDEIPAIRHELHNLMARAGIQKKSRRKLLHALDGLAATTLLDLPPGSSYRELFAEVLRRRRDRLTQWQAIIHEWNRLHDLVDQRAAEKRRKKKQAREAPLPQAPVNVLLTGPAQRAARQQYLVMRVVGPAPVAEAELPMTAEENWQQGAAFFAEQLAVFQEAERMSQATATLFEGPDQIFRDAAAQLAQVRRSLPGVLARGEPDELAKTAAELEKLRSQTVDDLIRRTPGDLIFTNETKSRFVPKDSQDLPQNVDAEVGSEDRAFQDALMATHQQRRRLGEQIVLELAAWQRRLEQALSGAATGLIIGGIQPLAEAMTVLVPPRLRQSNSASGCCEKTDNIGLFHHQEPWPFAKRLVGDAVHQIAELRPSDAEQIRRRAAALLRVANADPKQPPPTTVSTNADAVAVLGLHQHPEHQPNKGNKYLIKAQRYQQEHELAAWLGMDMLALLIAGKPGQRDLGWHVFLRDGKSENRGTLYLSKRVEVADANVAPFTEVPDAEFWHQLRSQPPVGPVARRVSSLAQAAVVELLLGGAPVDLRQVLGLEPAVLGEELGTVAHQDGSDPAEAINYQVEFTAFTTAVGNRLQSMIEQPPPYWRRQMGVAERSELKLDPKSAQLSLIDATP